MTPYTFFQACIFLFSEHELEIITGLEDLWIKEDQNAVFMCELSMEEMPGEWYKNGSRIRPTATIKTRTEGEDELNRTNPLRFFSTYFYVQYQIWN